MTLNMRKLEAISYSATLAASLLLCYVLVTSFILRSSNPAQHGTNTAAKGQSVSIAGVDWTKSNRSVVLALSTHCPYCISSTAFYRSLSKARQTAHSQIQLIAVLPEENENATSFLNAHDVQVDQVKSTSLIDLSVEATPTLLVVDSRGKVINEWVGKLSIKDEQEVLKTVRD